MTAGNQSITGAKDQNGSDAARKLSVANVAANGGTLKWGSTGLASSISGELALNGGNFTLLGGTLTAGELAASGGTLQLDANSTLKFDATSNGNQTLTGLTLAANSTLEFGESVTNGTLNLGTLTLNGNANLVLNGTLSDLQLAATGLPGGTNKLTITLSEDFLESVAGDSRSGEYQLFSDDSWKDSGFVQFADVLGYEIGWGSNGNITVNAAEGFLWNAGEDEDHSFTWKTSGQEESWTTGGTGTPGNNDVVTFENPLSEGVTVAISGGQVRAGKLVTSGESKITFGGSISAVNLNLGTDVQFNGELYVSGQMLIKTNKTVSFFNSSPHFNSGSSIHLESNAVLDISNNTSLNGPGNGQRCSVEGNGGTVRFHNSAGTNSRSLDGASFGEGVTVARIPG